MYVFSFISIFCWFFLKFFVLVAKKQIRGTEGMIRRGWSWWLQTENSHVIATATTNSTFLLKCKASWRTTDAARRACTDPPILSTQETVYAFFLNKCSNFPPKIQKNNPKIWPSSILKATVTMGIIGRLDPTLSFKNRAAIYLWI